MAQIRHFKNGLGREKIFVTSKLWPSEYGEGLTTEGIDKMLARLDTPYLDRKGNQPETGTMILMKWPDSSLAKMPLSG